MCLHGTLMQPYRLYFLGQGDHIAAVREQMCETDDEAMDWATTQADGRPMELWCLARRVKSFPVPGRKAPS